MDFTFILADLAENVDTSSQMEVNHTMILNFYKSSWRLYAINYIRMMHNFGTLSFSPGIIQLDYK